MALKLALVALAAVLTAAPSEPVVTGLGTRFFDGPPPARYIKEGFYNLLLVNPAQLNDACGVPNPPGLTLRGCTRTTKAGDRVVILPLSASPYNWFVLIHETGHVNGWGGEHPA